jgi:hypothetical protein
MDSLSPSQNSGYSRNHVGCVTPTVLHSIGKSASKSGANENGEMAYHLLTYDAVPRILQVNEEHVRQEVYM